MKRLWLVHECLMSHRLPNPDSQLQRLLLSAVQCYNFIKTSEGTRFAVFLFSLSPSFIPIIHDAVKQRLPGCSRQVACTYGEIYHKVSYA